MTPPALHQSLISQDSAAATQSLDRFAVKKQDKLSKRRRQNFLP